METRGHHAAGRLSVAESGVIEAVAAAGFHAEVVSWSDLRAEGNDVKAHFDLIVIGTGSAVIILLTVGAFQLALILSIGVPVSIGLFMLLFRDELQQLESRMRKYETWNYVNFSCG